MQFDKPSGCRPSFLEKCYRNTLYLYSVVAYFQFSFVYQCQLIFFEKKPQINDITLRKCLKNSCDRVCIVKEDEALYHLDEVGSLGIALTIQIDQLLQKLVPKMEMGQM